MNKLLMNNSPWDPRRSLACLNMNKSNSNSKDPPVVSDPIDQRLVAELSANPLLAPQSLSWLGDFPRGVHTNVAGHVSLDGWLAQWSMTALLQPFTAALYLRYLGFQGDISSALIPTRRRRVENRNNSLQRTVVRGFVFGAKGVGKSSLLDALTRKATAGVAGQTERGAEGGTKSHVDRPRSASAMVHSRATTERSANSVGGSGSNISNSGGQDRGSYLVLTEVPDTDAGRREALDGMRDCDLAVLVLDASDPGSVTSLRNIQRQIPESVPCVYLANKVDLVEPVRGATGEVDGVDAGNDDVDHNDGGVATKSSEVATSVVDASAADGAAADGVDAAEDGQGEGVSLPQKGDDVSAASAERVHGGAESSISGGGGGLGSGSVEQRRAHDAMDAAIDLCSLYNLADPEPVTLAGGDVSDENQRARKLERLFELLLTIALRPDAARPISDERRTSLRRARVLRATLRISAVAVSFALSGYLMWKLGVGARSSSSNNNNNTNNTSGGSNPSPPVLRINRTPTMIIRQRQAGLSSSH
jgi:hypothetical protein